ncbi:hypothetical protein VCHA50O407_230072 [Vibrio chagasii]|nr:hypothetical protein VCHA50P424_140073 [Vibrio chagasii]CAH7151931.1 hypothetical protein VCHA50O407_230072 [Vibrio chagasii]
MSLPQRRQNFTEIELRKNEIENASGGEEECVFGHLIVFPAIYTLATSNIDLQINQNKFPIFITS